MGLFSSQISTKALVPVCRQLATSYGAGIPILRSLDMLVENTKDPRIREVLRGMHDQIRNGSTLAEAARSQSRYLSPLFIELLASGEAGGRLDVILLDVANYYEDRLEMNRSIIGKAAYPVLQLTVAWFLGTFALMLVRRMGYGMRHFSFSGYLKFYIAFQCSAVLIFATIFAVCVVLARKGIFQWIWGWVATNVWPLAPVTLRFAQARFFRSLSLLIASGMPITRAIERSAAVAGNPYVERDLLGAIPYIKEGSTLVQAFSSSRYLSRTAREMLSVGEESGQLEQCLHKVAEYQMAEALQAVNLASRVGEVVVLLAVGLVTGYIIISFYSTYYGRMLDEVTR